MQQSFCNINTPGRSCQWLWQVCLRGASKRR